MRRIVFLFSRVFIGLVSALSFASEPRKVGDINNDGELSVVDLTLLRRHVRGLDKLGAVDLAFADVNQDGVVNEDDARALIRLITGEDVSRPLPMTGIRETSPSNGEEAVSSYRRTGIIVRFSMPVESSPVFSDRSIFGASVNGVLLNSRAELSSDGRKLALFVTDKIPGNARVDVSLNTDSIKDLLGRGIDGDGDGKAGGVFRFHYATESLVVIPDTEIKGRVFAAEKRDGQNVPLKGVIVRVAGAENAQVLTDENGAFTLACPAGRFFAEVDGRKVLGDNAFPDNAYYPFVVKAWDAVAGSKENLAVGTGEIFLPLIPSGALKVVDPNKETKVEVAPTVVAANPALAEISLTVPAGALRKEDGTLGGRIGMAPVPADRLPEPLAPGLDFPLVITIQTDGAGTFDQPVAVKFPNLPDQNGKKLAPGEKTGLWSFNHDTGLWELQGPMTVTDDGMYVTTDPGVGVRQPGWHGVLPGSQGVGPKRAASAPVLPKAVHEDVDTALRTAAQSSLAVRDAFMLLGQMRSHAENLEEIVRLLQEVRSIVETYNTSGAVPFWWSTYWLKLRIAKLKPRYTQMLPGEPRDLASDLTALQPYVATIRSQLEKLYDFNQKAYAASDSYSWLSIQFADSNAALLGMLKEFQAYTDDIKPVVGRFSTTAFDEVAKVLFPGFGQPEPTRDQEMDALSKFLTAMEVVSTSIPPDHSQRLGNIKLQMSDYLARAGALSTARGAPSKYGYIKVDAIGEPQRIRSNAAGDYRMVLPPDREFSVTYVDPKTLQMGAYVGISGWNGTITDLYGPVLAPLQPDSAESLQRQYARDTDNDKLADELEIVIGTNVGTEAVAPLSPRTFADTDGDGVSDYREVTRGKNPVSGLAVGTGVIFTSPTSQPGHEATDVDAGNELLLLSERKANGEPVGGLMIYSLESKTEPLRQAWLPMEYPVYRVRYADTNLAVLSLRENGVAVVDVSSPTNPVLMRKYSQAEGESVSAAILVGDTLVLGVNNPSAGTAKIVLKSLDKGDTIWEEPAGASISDVVANGTVVYALSRGNRSADQWWWYWNATSAVFVGDIDRVRTPPIGESLFRSVTIRQWEYSAAGGRLALAPGKLFYVHESGLSCLNTQDPLNPMPEGDVYTIDSGFQRGWNHAVFDGSVDAKGKMTFLASIGSSPAVDATRPDLDGDVTEFQYGKAGAFENSQGWWEYWLNNDTLITKLLKAFETRANRQRTPASASGAVSSLVLAGGIIYAADKEEGLKVINYKKYDSEGRLPAVELRTNSPSPNRLAVQRARAGSLLSLSASPSDDVAVSSVDWYLNGARVAVTGGYPWGYTVRLPALEPAETRRIKVEARVYDTGGNMSSSERFLDVVADPYPPSVVSAHPDSAHFEVRQLKVVFSEPMDASTFAGSLRIRTAGADAKLGTADDGELSLSDAKVVPSGETLSVEFAAPLQEGAYQAVIAGSVSDVAGNPMGVDYVWNFGVSLSNRWLGGLGLWSDPTKWSAGEVPAPGTAVVFPGYGASASPNIIVGVRTTFKPSEGTLLTGTSTVTQVLTKGIGGGWWGDSSSSLPATPVQSGMLVTGSMVAEGTFVKSVSVTEDTTDPTNQKQTTVIQLSKPLDPERPGVFPWELETGARLASVLVEGETTIVDVDLDLDDALTLSANLGFGGSSTLGVGTVNVVLAGAQIRSVAAVNTGSLLAGRIDSGKADLKFTRPLMLSGSLALEAAGLRDSDGKMTTSRLQLASPLDLAGHELRIYGGYAGSVVMQAPVRGGTFALTGAGRLSFAWKQSLLDAEGADLDKLLMRVSSGTVALSEDVTLEVAGRGKVQFFSNNLYHYGPVRIAERGWLRVYNYERAGSTATETLERDAVLERLKTDTGLDTGNLFSFGSNKGLALKQDGSLWAWGYNGQGRLGAGSSSDWIDVPTQVGSDTDWRSVYSGSDYNSGTFALKQDGSLWAWGNNWNGWLGVGSYSDWIDVPTQVGSDTDWRSVYSGSYHNPMTFALKQDGSLWAWGYNGQGWLGVGSSSEWISVPTQVGSDTDWKALHASSSNKIFALKQDGSLWAWGYNWQGWLGVGSSSDWIDVPTQVGSDTDWRSVENDHHRTFALKQDGSLWAWGYNWLGLLGVGSPSEWITVPTQVGSDTDWRSVRTDYGWVTFALKQDGSLWAWGDNWNGLLGVGSSSERISVPTQVGSDTDWRSVRPDYGSGGTFALKQDGSLWAWGYNWNGSLGVGSVRGWVTVPTQVGAFADVFAPVSPVVSGVTPGFWNREVSRFSLAFGEPMEQASLTGSLTLFSAGPDGLLGTPDDLAVKGGVLSLGTASVAVDFSEPLPEGRYRAILSGAVADLVGNTLGANYTWDFGVALVNSWLGGSGLLSDPAKWSLGTVPVAGDSLVFPSGTEPNLVIGGRATFRPAGENMVAGRTTFTRVLGTGTDGAVRVVGGGVGTSTTPIYKGMQVKGAMVAEGTHVKSVKITQDLSDPSNQLQTTVFELSKPLTDTVAGASVWTFTSGVNLDSVTVHGDTTLVDVDLEVRDTLTLAANFDFGGTSTLGVGAVETIAEGSQIRSVAAVNTGSLVAGRTDTGMANLRLTKPLALSGDLSLESAGFRSDAGTLTSSMLQLVSPLDLNGHKLKIYGGYSGSVAFGPMLDDVKDGLEAYYPFNGNSVDESGKGNHLETSGSAALSTDRFGKSEGCYEFTGLDSVLLKKGSESLLLEDTFTLSMWFQTENDDNMGSEADTGTSYNHHYLFFPAQLGATLAGVGISAGKNGVNVLEHGDHYLPTVLVYRAALGSGWNHVAVTYSADEAPVLYVNGVVVRTGIKSTKKKALYLRAGEMQIGQGTYGRFNGKIDDIRIYSRAISEAEVAAVFASESVSRFSGMGQSSDQDSFVLNGPGTLAFDWKQSLFEMENADWDLFSMTAKTGSITIPEAVTVAVAGLGKVRFSAKAFVNQGIIKLDELGHLTIQNYTKVGDKSQEIRGRDAVLETSGPDLGPAADQKTSAP